MKRLSLLMTVLLGSALLLVGCSLRATTPSESGVVEIVMRDYNFSTDVIRVKAGDTVTIVLSNEGKKLHEFMIGRDPFVENNFTEGFSEDFFLRIPPDQIQVEGPAMVMGLPSAGDMEGMDMGGEEADHDEEMPAGEMDMSEEEMPADGDMEMGEGMEMPAEGGDGDGEEHGEEEMAGMFGPFQLPLMELHAGVMFMIDPAMVSPGEVTKITFTVPEDVVGEWEIGCFQERGQHYDDGMRGKFIVEPAS